MTQTPTIAQLRREARALVNDADMPVGLGAVLKLFALKLDAIADGERHNLPGGCGHLFEGHDRSGCTLCHCVFVPIREIARQEAVSAAHGALTQPQGASFNLAPLPVVDPVAYEPEIVTIAHDCVLEHDWPDNPVPFEATSCACGHLWTYIGNGLWTDDEQEVSTER